VGFLRRALSATVLGLIACYLIIPVITILLFSLSTDWSTTVVPKGYTLTVYDYILHHPDFWVSMLHSGMLSIGTAVASLLLVVPTAFWCRFRASKMGELIEVLSIMPYATPGIILAFGLITTYANVPLPLIGSPVLLLCGTVILTLPATYRAVDSNLEAIDARTMVEAAASLGAGWMTTFTRVLIPNLLPGIISGGLLALALAFGEFVLARLLVGSGWLTVQVWMANNLRVDGRLASALSVISFATLWLCMMGALGLFSKRQKSTLRVGR
jgi:putative spermidine/putrescine transport system permease protein